MPLGAGVNGKILGEDAAAGERPAHFLDQQAAAGRANLVETTEKCFLPDRVARHAVQVVETDQVQGLQPLEACGSFLFQPAEMHNGQTYNGFHRDEPPGILRR